MDSCESHDTGQGTFRPPTESFSFKHALLHLMILVKPAYEGYFNRIGSAPFLALVLSLSTFPILLEISILLKGPPGVFAAPPGYVTLKIVRTWSDPRIDPSPKSPCSPGPGSPAGSFYCYVPFSTY